MEPISHVVKSSLPNYLSSLPIPDSFGGWFKLSFKDWLALIPPTVVVAGLGYTTYLAFCPAARCAGKDSGRCNSSIRKNEAKVVTMVDVEDIAGQAAFCRCWKTKNWPYCDGSHGEHNKQTGDNVGPVVVKKK
ncbi:GL13882 [Drosophila persimilis]|uniref:CDGSH iron-sulfur domain-containing protein 2 homolog n=3 Tax=pseudoobscura subgroup TaxID=32358 RepID=CISD2_DROPS|nr:CDGSH iron-sulfur domain-containing protein 2 homolog [Drosophila pseudoobscura]XP_002020251.1 CDGSH iron-sulfur domain-containing protein 2 homolog [Drosophila persimilis]B4GPI0.1 RecName: Full=CDGSH iron-sulfur domain-containing protein 2 homolog [Drosophila persimilis]Q29BX8.2 RecName: Full=CDGSH iron-sulfur domain-containing protein 2 homolog [Drosophila pseudoobscura pseudoobscura]EDW39063.1 GL13882 [Drosophila persimilis]